MSVIVDVVNNFDFSSDHRMVRTVLNFSLNPSRARRGPPQTQKLNRALFKYALEREIEVLGPNPSYEAVVQSIRRSGEIAKETAPRAHTLSQKTRDLLLKRRQLLTNGRQPHIEWVLTNKALRLSWREDRVKRFDEVVSDAVRKGKSWRKAVQSQSVGRRLITSIKNSNGQLVYQPHQVDQVFQSFYNELYLGNSGDDYAIVREEEEWVDIGQDEVYARLSTLTSGKSPGHDGITGEMLRIGAEILAPALTNIFNQCLNGQIPSGFGDGRTILLVKNGDPTLTKNYRPITLLPVIQKTFSKVLNHRLAPILDGQRSISQMGFRSNYSTLDGIFTLNQLISNCREYQLPLYLLFLDIQKAFDCVLSGAVYEALQKQGVHPKLVDYLYRLNRESSNTLIINNREVPLEVGRGVRQGDCLSPRLFTSTLEESFRALDWSRKGININGRYLSHLLFADDAVLISHDSRQIQHMVDELIVTLGSVGLTLNASKTVAITTNPRGREVTINGQSVRVVERCVYLGQEVSLDHNPFKSEIKRRIRAGRFAFTKYHSLLTNRKVPMPIKQRLFNGAILPALTYGCETWALTRGLQNELAVAQRRLERLMLGISIFDKRTNDWVRRRTGLKDVTRFCEERKHAWAGRLARGDRSGWAGAIVEWHPRGPIRKKGRPAVRWRDSLVETLGANFLAALSS